MLLFKKSQNPKRLTIRKLNGVEEVFAMHGFLRFPCACNYQYSHAFSQRRNFQFNGNLKIVYFLMHLV
jgi:hypothetical protein